LKKIVITIALIMFAFTFLLYGCGNPNNINNANKPAPAVTQSFGNEKAISLIAKHNNISEDIIKIHEIKKVEKNHWFVLYQLKSNNGTAWEPSNDSDFGIEIKNSAGNYQTNNHGYTMPAVFLTLE
jgi:hypothetical protein